MKRSTSLHNNTPEVIVDISDKWKHRAMPYKPHDNESTFKRIFVAASNIERNAEDGCMKKIKIQTYNINVQRMQQKQIYMKVNKHK